jgi:hypothetical protein
MHNIFNSTLAMFRKPQNGMDRSCAATIYPMLDKPRTTGAFQDRRKIEALLRPA